MVIDVLKLKEGTPEHLSEALDAKEIDVEYVDFHYKTEIKVDGIAEKILSTVTFYGVIRSAAEHTCARCLKIVEETVEDRLNLSYDVAGIEQINLLEDIRDVLLLAHGERFLCQPNCKGLCQSCGANLNEVNCQCKNEMRGNAFSELKNIFKLKEK